MSSVSWFSRLVRRRPVAPVPAVAPDANLAAGLLQSAHAMAGLDPHEAQRLRGAAQTWLSVIR